MSQQFSMRIVKILRHNTEGLSMTSDGYVSVSDLLKHLRSDYSEQDVKRLVQRDPKNRFALKQDGNRLLIQATNGHTLPINVPMKPTTQKIGLHGTFRHNWEHIKSQGLSRKNRNHIHFAYSGPGCKSGVPTNRDVMIEVDIEKARRDGIEFFESENGVILSPGNCDGVIGKKYFIRAYAITHVEGAELSLK